MKGLRNLCYKYQYELYSIYSFKYSAYLTAENWIVTQMKPTILQASCIMLFCTQEPQIPDHSKEKCLWHYFNVNQKTEQNKPQIHKFFITYCFFFFWNFAETSIIANHRTEFHFMFVVPPWGFLVILWSMLLVSFPIHHSPPQQSQEELEGSQERKN